MAAIGNFVGAAGQSPGGGEPSLNMQEAELSFQAVVDPYARADFFVTLESGGGGPRGGLHHLPDPPRRLPHEGREDARRLRQGERTAPAHAPVGRPPLVSKNLPGGEDGLADAGISVARLIPNPWLFLEATGQVYQGDSEVFKAPDPE